MSEDSLGRIAGPTAIEYVKQHMAHYWSNDQEERDEDGIDIMSRIDRAKTLLRCKKMVHVHKAGLLSGRDVSVGLFLLNMDQKASEPGVFYADFLMFLRQQDRPMILTDGWDSIGFANAKNIALIQTFGNKQGLRRIQGSFFFSPDLRWFPFESQHMDITVEQIVHPVTDWVFLPDWSLNGISSTVRFPGWQATLRDASSKDLGNCDATVDTRTMPGAIKLGMSKYTNVTFSTFTYRVTVSRPPAQVSLPFPPSPAAALPCPPPHMYKVQRLMIIFVCVCVCLCVHGGCLRRVWGWGWLVRESSRRLCRHLSSCRRASIPTCSIPSPTGPSV